MADRPPPESAAPGDAPLDGLTVLVTRPAHQAEPLCRLLEAAGATAVRFPTLAIEDVADTGPLLALIDRLEEFHLAVFISPNAVDRAMNLIQARRGGLPPGLELAAVGRGSARALRRHLGREPHYVPARGASSEALLEHPGLQDLAGRRVIIFRGDGGREYLAQEMRRRGAEVTYAECYRRTRPSADVEALQRRWAREGIDLVVATSGAGLRNLFDMVGPLAQHWLRRTPLVVVNPRLAAIARDLGVAPEPVVAADASDEAIVEAIRRWRAQRDPDHVEQQ